MKMAQVGTVPVIGAYQLLFQLGKELGARRGAKGGFMKKMFAVVAGVFVLAASLATADAATDSRTTGLQNSKRVMNHYKQRYLDVEKVKKRAHAQKKAQRETQRALAGAK
jgi:hypothetical protein